MWLQGLYDYKAVATAIANNFGSKAEYLKEPISLENEEDEKEFTEEEKIALQKKVLLQLQVMEMNYNHGNK